jgi:UDP-2,3-diacylglucosamine pyrophosphatase LpxH
MSAVGVAKTALTGGGGSHTIAVWLRSVSPMSTWATATAAARHSFARFLEDMAGWKEVARLVLLGDIMDMWRRDMAGVVLENAAVLSRLAALTARMRVYYVAGNHDYHLGGLKGFHYPYPFSRRLILREGGKTYRFCHGYEFDPSLSRGYFDALCYTGDDLGEVGGRAYDGVSRLLKTGQRATEKVVGMLLPPEKRLPSHEDAIHQRALASVKEGEVMVFGHTHWPFVQGNVANCGSWVADSMAL